MASAIAAGIPVVAVRHCGSTADGSPWLARASGAIDDWSQVSAEWVRSLAGANPKVTSE
jgi:predicted amidohydrolase